VHYCIGQIRAALGDRARDPRLILTVPKRGYRLRGDVLFSTNARPKDWKRRLAIAGLIVALGAATAFVERRPNNHHETGVAVLKALHGLIC